MASAPQWLRDAVVAAPQRFPLAVAAAALPSARLRGVSGLGVTHGEIAAGTSEELVGTQLGLGGAMSPLPAMLAREIAELEADGAAAGLIQTIEHHLHRLLCAAQVRRAVDDPAAHQATLALLCAASGYAAVAGRVVDGLTADAVATRLARVAGCRVRVVPLTGGELPLAPRIAAELGRARLGQDAALGRSLRARELGVRLELGPVAAAEAPALRPGGERHASLVAEVHRALPPGLAWRLELLLLTADAPRAGLGAGDLGGSVRLDGTARSCERELLASGPIGLQPHP